MTDPKVLWLQDHPGPDWIAISEERRIELGHKAGPLYPHPDYRVPAKVYKKRRWTQLSFRLPFARPHAGHLAEVEGSPGLSRFFAEIRSS
jgi:hypothetical protein